MRVTLHQQMRFIFICKVKQDENLSCNKRLKTTKS